MNNQEEIRKLKKAATTFNVFKFVGLGLLILGGIMLSWHSYSYLIVFFQYMLNDIGSAGAVADAALQYFANLFESLGILLVGLAMLITFSVLRGKKSKKIEELKRAEEIKEAVEAAVKE